MFEFYNDCVFKLVPNFNWAQLIAPIVALIAIVISIWNLNIVKTNQKIQTHINVLNMQKDIDEKQIKFNITNNKYNDMVTNNNFSNITNITDDLDDCFKQYITSVDRLGVLLNTDYFIKQFDKKIWRSEYYEMFKSAKNVYDNYSNIVLKNSIKITYITKTLTSWEIKQT